MTNRQKDLGLIFFPAYDWAISPTHPEREERLLYTHDQLMEEGIFDMEGISELRPDLATAEDVMKCHFCFPDVETVTTDSHMVSAGGALRAARAVLEGEVKQAFALVRPPGHHAMKTVHGNRGFCNINNEAIMIEYMRSKYGIKKIAIVDTDCHHGDGTQDIFWNDPDVLFISLHQDGRTLYPGSGHIEELGGPGAFGKTINIPLPPNTSDEGFLMAMERVVMPLLDNFKPEIIINSAGQDNHYSDPITNMNFSAIGYAKLNDILKPDIAVLEGGYSIQGALPYVNLGIILAMAGLDYSHIKEPDFNAKRYRQSTDVTKYISQLCDVIVENYYKANKTGKPSKEILKSSRNVFYDTDGIQESRKEEVHTCSDCTGLYIVESSSSRNSLSAGIEIPYNACDRCMNIADALIEKFTNDKKFKTVQLIDRRRKNFKYLKQER